MILVVQLYSPHKNRMTMFSIDMVLILYFLVDTVFLLFLVIVFTLSYQSLRQPLSQIVPFVSAALHSCLHTGLDSHAFDHSLMHLPLQLLFHHSVSSVHLLLALLIFVMLGFENFIVVITISQISVLNLDLHRIYSQVDAADFLVSLRVERPSGLHFLLRRSLKTKQQKGKKKTTTTLFHYHLMKLAFKVINIVLSVRSTMLLGSTELKF
mmetsp:Transcript_18808/g.24411  ORF Transcript_18808/g.24411 Transcript_18808/m.24411 type:complete len:210 (+) Transcript_18808:295-924(+)